MIATNCKIFLAIIKRGRLRVITIIMPPSNNIQLAIRISAYLSNLKAY